MERTFGVAPRLSATSVEDHATESSTPSANLEHPAAANMALQIELRRAIASQILARWTGTGRRGLQR